MQDDRILIVDDDEDILVAARLLLKRHYRNVVTTSDPGRLPELLRATSFDAVLLDMNYRTGERSGREGLHWLTHILDNDPDAVVIAITAYSAVDTAVEAMKRGAIDFVAKPWQNEKLVATINAALALRRSRLEADRLQAQNRALASQGKSDALLGESAAIRAVFQLIARAAPTDANVLILGENGTGKELVARELHRQSPCAGGIFLAVDLGAVAETLLASELFGHRKGAFTGADEHRIGRFQAASGGTLFLDELGNLPLHLQPKLLTALERREVVPVGANAPVPIDVRVVSATNVPRHELADDARFRQDLLYRLNTVEIELPPLRERPEDIPLLAEHFLGIYARKYGRAVRAISAEAMAAIRAYSWPGNVRALRHAVERALILSDGDTLRVADFPLPRVAAASDDAARPPATTLAEVEKRTIADALQRHRGNVTLAARELGITRTSLYRRMEKHGL